MVQHAHRTGTSQIKAVKKEHGTDNQGAKVESSEAHHSCTGAPLMSSSEVSVSAAYIEPASGRTLKVLTDGTLVITRGTSKPPTFSGADITIPAFLAVTQAPPAPALPMTPAFVAVASRPEKSASAPSSPPQPLAKDGRSQTIPEQPSGNVPPRTDAASAIALPPTAVSMQAAAATVKVEEAPSRPADVPGAAAPCQQASSEATEQGGSPSAVDAADKANSELLLNFANSAGTEQPHVSSALPSAAAEAAAALAGAEGVAASQRRAAADMLVRSLLDTIAQHSPGSTLPCEAAVMDSLQQLANKCMDRQLVPTEAELRAALERCLQRARSAASTSSTAALATTPTSRAAAALGPKGGGKGSTLPALAFTAPPAMGPQAASIPDSGAAWKSAALPAAVPAPLPAPLPAALVTLQTAVGSKRPADSHAQPFAATPKAARAHMPVASIPALPQLGTPGHPDAAAADASAPPPLSQREAEAMQLLRSLHSNPNVALKMLQKAMDRPGAPAPAPPTPPPAPLQPAPPAPTTTPESPGASRRALMQLLQQNPQLLTMLEQNPNNEGARAAINAVLSAAMPPPAAPQQPPELPLVQRDLQQAGAGDPAVMHALQAILQQRLLQSQLSHPTLAAPPMSFFAPSSAAPLGASMPQHCSMPPHCSMPGGIPASLFAAAAAAKNPLPASAAPAVDPNAFGAHVRGGRRLSTADEGAMAALARLQQMQPPPSPQLTADLLQRVGVLRMPSASLPGAAHSQGPPSSLPALDAVTLERLGQQAGQAVTAAPMPTARPPQHDTSHSELLQLLETVARTGRPLRRQSSGQPNGASST